MELQMVRPTVLITGASDGIGSELVPYFAGTGHNVVLVAPEKPVLEGIAAAVRNVFGVDTVVIACDIADPDGVQTVCAELARQKIDVDVLVNNAGFDEASASGLETEARILQANIVSLTVLTQRLLPGMIARGRGRILNVAAAAGFSPVPLHSVYDGAKAYVLRFSESLAEELKGSGVTVTSLCPDSDGTVPARTADVEPVRPFQKPASSDRTAARMGFRALIRGERVANIGWGNRPFVSLIA